MIYLVEDDDNIRKLVSYALGKEGFGIKEFSSPSAFWSEIKKANNASPQLILLDIMLPEEDGLSILTRLRETAGTKDIPVIMLTAKGSEFDKVTGLDADEIERLIAMGAVRPAEPQAAPAEPQDEQAKAARRKRQP